MFGIALVFLAKAVALAFWITPLWDIPDETGHYAIVADLAAGGRLPLPGRSFVPSDVMSDWTRGKSTEPLLNWVAQHPPLYHLMAAPLVAGARLLTADPHTIERAPRLLSALAGAAALLLFFAALREASGDPIFSFAAAAGVSFIPMYSHLSSGTNHDTFLAFFAGLAALCWVRFERSGLFSDSLRMGVALALAGAVKLSAVALAAALWLLCLPRLAGRGSQRAARAIAVGAVSVSLPLLWALRHWWLLGNTRVHPVSDKPFDPASFFAYLRNEPVVDHTFKNFFGLIGWTGTGGGEVRWFQISGPFLAPYILLGLAGAAGAAIWLGTRLERGRARLVFGGIAAAVFAVCFFWLFSGAEGTQPVKRLLYSLLAASPFLALPLAFRKREPGEAIVSGSHFVFLSFSAAYLVNSFEAYLIYGQMRATNGRYYFAVLPFLLLAFALPAASFWRPGRGRDAALLIVLAALFVNEALFFVLKVFPFYAGHG
jgi:dolichyl-phosphate-mannose-protein mannosyltransferase